MPYDHYLFTGGLQQAGKFLKFSQGHTVYTITKYESLAHILGQGWHLRALNKEKDFSYVILDTVEFYLHRRSSVEDAIDPERSVDGGYVLVFEFTRGDGEESDWDDMVHN